MDDKDFSLDSIINEVNAKTGNKKTRDISELDDISFKKNSSDVNKNSDKISNALISDMKEEAIKSMSETDEQALDEASSVLNVDNKDTDDNENTEANADDSMKNDQVLNSAIKDSKPENDVDPDLSDEKDKSFIVEDNTVKKPSKMNIAAAKAVTKKKKKKKTFNASIFGGLILVTIILTISLAVAIGGISLGMEYTGIGKSDSEITFNIPKNSTTDEIAQILYDNKIIENKQLFKLAMKIKSPAAIYPGDITLHASMGYPTIIETLATMRENYETVTITFKEGLTLLEVANLLQENQVCSAEDFLFEFNRMQGFDFENDLDSTADSFYKMEGFFFPDTYEFYVDDSAYNVTKIIRQHFDEKITDSMYKKMKENHMTLSEVMTLASIVQWEANSAEDMPKVASVFINRLDDPDTFPSLQSDATKNYIKKVIDVVADNDASIDHYTDCYDTYACQGLPAGPICNPGLDAINAVLEPDTTDYYYFCNNLETGKSYFAKTLEEHEKNLKKAGLS
ncbi:MAG: endolytic transglycosylase MltG [Oscillospiraceae bacterium]